MQISFGKGQEKFWTNVFPSELVAKHSKDIQKFGRVLNIIKRFEPIFAVISVQAMLKMFNFPRDFGDRLIFPLIALFMVRFTCTCQAVHTSSLRQGTGNQTPHVSSAILERLFLDPNMSLFEYSSSSLLADVPTMLAFPSLHDVYDAWKRHIEERGAEVFLNTEVTRVLKREKGNVLICANKFSPGTIRERILRQFDQVIFAVDADSCLNILAENATWKEKKILGNVKYFYDITVTHFDREYMKKVIKPYIHASDY